MDAAALREELARQDAETAAALRQVDELADACAGVGVREAATRALLAELPAESARRESDLAHAREELGEALAAVERAQAELVAVERSADEARRATARRTLDHALATQQVAEQHEARLRDRLSALDAEADAARTEREHLVERAHTLAHELHAIARLAGRAPFDPPDADSLADWASRVRAALVVTRSALAAERDALLRQVAELAALSEPR